MSRLLKDETYAIVPNQAIRDKRLNLSSLGMWAFLWNLPNGWEYSVSGLAVAKGCGIRAATTAVKALEKYGYLKRIQRREGNKFAGYDYQLIPNPQNKSDAEISFAQNAYNDNCDNDNIVVRKTEANKITTNKKYNNKISNDNLDSDLVEMARREYLIT